MSAGVYLLEHVPTGRFYIGSSVELERRERRWFDRLCELAALPVGGVWRGRSLPPFFVSTAAGSRVEDWRFRVVHEFAPAARLDLRREERRVIERELRERPDLCMNNEWFLLYGPRRSRSDRQRAWKRPGV